MAKRLKTPFEKLETKISSVLANNAGLNKTGRRIKYQGDLLLTFNESQVSYSKRRYYHTAEVKIAEVEYAIKIHLTTDTIGLISRTSIKPPNFIQYLRNLFKITTQIEFNLIEIGTVNCEIVDRTLKISYPVYSTLERINKEERIDETIRFKTRAANILHSNYGLNLNIGNFQIDWGARLQEILASGQFNQNDIQALASKLEPGDSNQIVIKKQVDKQVEWLLDKLEDILDEENLNKTKAKALGSSIFNYPKTEINGAEHLMEKILTDYGQNTIFGVPALINTNKYVLQDGLPRIQFDLLLVTSLGDIEVVELKKSDTILLDFDSHRNKFYASSELSKAISQTERYITAIMKDNDDEFTINGQRVREFINAELSGLLHVETLRPTGLVVIGSSKTIAVQYDYLNDELKDKFKKANYNANCERAYRELRDSHKNIKIVTYSDLVESARLRLQLDAT